MTRHTFALLFVILIALLAGGCPSLTNKSLPQEEPKPEQIFEKGQTLFEKKKYAEAIQVWESLKSAHPDFAKMPEVYIKLADASFKSSTYDDAIGRYRQYIELYPTHDDALRAKYMVGMCYYSQIKPTDLDSGSLGYAASEFESIRDGSSDNEWKKKADEKYRDCRKKIGEKELYKARTYLSLRQYKSARMAAQRVMDEFKDLGLDEKAQAILDKTKDK
jgi:outer membrane protein assembly factor BamD